MLVKVTVEYKKEVIVDLGEKYTHREVDLGFPEDFTEIETALENTRVEKGETSMECLT